MRKKEHKVKGHLPFWTCPHNKYPQNFNKNVGFDRQTLAIFELLDHIVSEPTPELYYFDASEGCIEFFSEDFVEFVNSMIQRNMSNRPDLESLMQMSYFKKSVLSEDKVHLYFSEWMTFVIENLYQN